MSLDGLRRVEKDKSPENDESTNVDKFNEALRAVGIEQSISANVDFQALRAKILSKPPENDAALLEYASQLDEMLKAFDGLVLTNEQRLDDRLHSADRALYNDFDECFFALTKRIQELHPVKTGADEKANWKLYDDVVSKVWSSSQAGKRAHEPYSSQ